MDYSQQLQKLKSEPWAVVSMRDTTGSDGKTYNMAVVELDTVMMWLTTIDEDRVNEASRPLVVSHQTELKAVIASS
ncbi:hypothetical protein J433_00630 [Corynebacterium glutamicum MT]|uniref:Antirepressor protein ant N-terminal domain-containing protein n=1 Tax=Corynebacterium glutamicum TaxID=1718 RepID=A0AB36I6R5_CORGT|nr:phage antirepressor N-terminal domain-containing protein [Corynebacterium glutamicum]AGN21587.1 hypothetical protein C629_04895 [Corynebacterium glutamicum SCgG2]EGV39364.1 hypothetical protein CgS9114_12896 [Corynebacterium glutamicum S9114]EOA66202.1 hypothetical protein J433_00630 [Corynebacterium glutamicum MT]EPP41316.1 hypothetical protein A583_04408 [Corynebacterium glutamicum Z188]AGN18564.1 hypothetical protein C624_04895 [Corynebacterium glutamicum SCgG1]